MIYLIILYIVFIILLIVKNYQNKNITWFVIMLVGFCLAIFGLAFYTTYINYACMLENRLFKDIDKYIWLLNYYLKLDIYRIYRIMNIGTAVYIYGAMCYSITYFNTIHKQKYYVLLSIIPLLLIIIYDPIILGKIYKIKKYPFYEQSIINIDSTMKSINNIFNIVIKSYLFGSIMNMIYHYIKTPHILLKKYKYIIIGIIPINILFFVLFFRFPNHRIVFRRYEQLHIYSYTYSNMLYKTISFICIISVIILIYALLKYNIFETNVRKTQIDFENQVKTAHFGIKIFSHSIKNQFIAVKFLSEQLTKETDENKKKELQRQIVTVCNESIDRLGSLSRKIEKIDLKYEKIFINEEIHNIIMKFQGMYKEIHFIQNNIKEVYLYIDKKQFKKVIENNLINAIEACNNNENTTIIIVIEEKSNYGIIKIIDNGQGIHKKDIKKIFRPFYSTKPTVSNWGVGLAFCQKVINAFGGVIHINSVEGKGTCVEIYIPNIRRL
ncbi:hypothetical protein AN2V17_42130 [Vallitalea sp. AN17-2]|uniref:Uncharacterized protein n=2 Tax=Vallitalea maricola TaxID=3074433 RepID=A0ACB5UR57_9FIRM|nr:hypothetical protein AN2V17_42130 [Vallitalea sp. AN17-2]